MDFLDLKKICGNLPPIKTNFEGIIMSESAKTGPSGTWYMVMGVVLALGGIYCLFNPFSATLATTLIAGWLFLFGGAIQIFAAVTSDEESMGGKLWSGVLGLILVWFGISLVANPLEGVLSLTLLVAIMFLLSGVARMMIGMRVRPMAGWGLILFSGVISIILALLVFSNFSNWAATLLGVLLGIDLLSSGITYLFVALSMKK